MSSITELFKEQERTTDEVKRLRMEFSNFFDAERSKSLGLAEALREKKGDDDPVITTGSKTKASDDSKSALGSILEKATGSLLGKIATGALAAAVTAAIAAGIKVGFNDIKQELRNFFGLDDEGTGAGGGNPMLDPAVQLGVFGRAGGNIAGRGFARLQPVGPRASLPEFYRDYVRTNTTPAVEPKSYVTRINGVEQPRGGAPAKPPSVTARAGAVAKEVVARNIGRIGASAAPLVGTGVSLVAAGQLLAEGKLSSALITALGGLPGVGTLTSLGAGSVVMVRETYKSLYGTYPSEDAAKEMMANGGRAPTQTFEKLKVAGGAVIDALKPEIQPLGNRVSFSQSLTQATEGAAKFDANRAARMSAMDAKFTNGIPNDLMLQGLPTMNAQGQPIVSNVNVVNNGGGGGTPAGGINPPTEKSGSMLDANNSALNQSAL